MPLQKSFSEQARFRRQRPSHWQRSKSHSAVTQPAAPKSPIQVSLATKNKLQQFQFRNPQDEAANCLSRPLLAEGQNETVGRRAEATINDDFLKGNLEKTNLKAASPSLAADVTSSVTPESKLAWQDLMGVTNPEREEKETSPKERLLWHNETDEIAAQISPLVPRRGKKRARSSSPTSSPSYSKSTTPVVNVKKLTKALKSPDADPALDLWDRFATGGPDNKTPLGAANPALARLMASCSPHPPRNGAVNTGESPLRRAVSCGTSWPKRRKIGGESPNGRPRAPIAASKSSMVTALLETVTGEINKTEEVDVKGLEAAQSPTPQKRRSPCTAKVSVETEGRPELPAAPPPASDRSPSPDLHDANTPTSDYGDDEFDDDTLLELDASLNTGQVEGAKLSARGADAPDARQESARQEMEFDDEFGDIDDDLLAAAEDILAEASTKANSRPPQVPAAHQAGLDYGTEEADDEYGDDFGGDFDFEAAEFAATQSIAQSTSSLSHPSQKATAIQRYLVTNVLQSSYTDDRGCDAPEMILVVQAERSKTIKAVHLRGDWVDTPVSAKSHVHIIGDFESSGQCIIDNSRNILILHPDQLISSTVVADSFSCMRRAVLQDRVKATSEPTLPLVYGTILHEIYQEALLANDWESAFLGAVIEKAMKRHIEDLYTVKLSFNDAREHLLSKMDELRHWAQKFVSCYPKPEAVAHARNGEKTSMCVSKLLDIEEHVWSPMYGLKGNIDATVQVTVGREADRRTLTVPFEVKTGKNVNESHQAQTMLYNLLLSDRYDIEIVCGILYYMETSLTKIIPTVRNDLRQMIKQRNQLACYIRERSVQLPPMKRSPHACGNCYANTSCFTYHKLADDGDGESSGLKDKFDQVVRHLSPAHKDFFLKWEDLLTKEEKESQKLRRELWTMLSSEREKLGRCFGNVIIEDGSASEDQQGAKINRFHYTFRKQTAPSSFSFLDSQLAVGEPIVVSDEQGHFALALGFVTAVKKQRISVAVDRRLHNARIRQPGFDEAKNQVFASIMEVLPEGVRAEHSKANIKEAPIRYRLDKDEFGNGMAIVRNNLVQVMADSPFGSSKIRRIVVDLAPPEFKDEATQYTIADRDSLNVDQKKAIEKVMSAKDYALVLGMPGTGKTTTIAHIIRALICQKKSVLLTSYTHTAVDNILLKLKKDNIPILRLGAPAKVHPEVRDFAILAGQPMDTFEEIRSAWHDTPVVATTCLGTSHAIFNERTFDYCIVDEASQITLPICLGPIRMANTFVLVGDHNQLPPLVQNEDARLGGLDISLFKLLSDTHPESVVNLEHQYRMCEDIMALSNTLIYEGRLKCGTEEVRSRKLDVPNMDALRRHHFDAATFLSTRPSSQTSVCAGGNCWLRDLLDPEVRVSFINTDALPSSREEAKGNRIVNPCEARIVVQLAEALLTVGVPADEIGVMTHYRSQLSLLKHSLRGHGGIEMHTADRFQGRDKEVVVLSLVRSNEACNIGDLLKDWRRINVAFTRAKTKLLVVGSRDTLKGSGNEEMLSRFIGLMEERAWIYDLPATALESHYFEGAATQATASAAGPRSPVKNGEKRSARSSPPKRPPIKRSPKRAVGGGVGKENQAPGPKRAKIGERAIFNGRPVSRDIFNDLTSGIY